MAGFLENVPLVNVFDKQAKLLWLRVRLMGKAKKAFKQFLEATRPSYFDVSKALKERLECVSQ